MLITCTKVTEGYISVPRVFICRFEDSPHTSCCERWSNLGLFLVFDFKTETKYVLCSQWQDCFRAHYWNYLERMMNAVLYPLLRSQISGRLCERDINIAIKKNECNFYAKISFWWNYLLHNWIKFSVYILLISVMACQN